MNSPNYGKRQGTLKNNSEWRTARRIEVHYSMFATPFSIRCAVSYLFNVLYSRFAIQYSPRRSPFAAPFAIRLVIRRAVRRAVRHSPRHSLRRSPFAAPFPIHFRYSNFAIQCSPRRYPFAVRHSSIAEPCAIRRAIHCRFSMSPDAFHTKWSEIMYFGQSEHFLPHMWHPSRFITK